MHLVVSLTFCIIWRCWECPEAGQLDLNASTVLSAQNMMVLRNAILNVS